MTIILLGTSCFLFSHITPYLCNLLELSFDWIDLYPECKGWFPNLNLSTVNPFIPSLFICWAMVNLIIDQTFLLEGTFISFVVSFDSPWLFLTFKLWNRFNKCGIINRLTLPVRMFISRIFLCFNCELQKVLCFILFLSSKDIRFIRSSWYF